MNVVPQYKVFGPYISCLLAQFIFIRYNPVMTGLYLTKTNYAKRQDIGQTSGKMHLILKIKNCVIR